MSRKRRMKTISLAGRLVDFALPRPCAVCGDRLNPGEDFVCARCNLHLPRTGYADSPEDNEMARILWGRMTVERCAALLHFHYGSEAAHVVYGLKYFDHPDYGYLMGRMMGREMGRSGFFEGMDLIIPVPLARKRQWQRGYNQSEEIAEGLSRETGLPVARHVLRRQKVTESQTRKDRWERNVNMEDAFRMVRAGRIAHRHVLLVDDVVTTGATICACAKALEAAGDVRISVLSIGFVKS